MELRRLLSGVNFGNFSTANTAGVLTLNGTAAITGTSLGLTNGGSGQVATAFSNAAYSVRGFTTTFKFTQSGSADGMTFTLQNVAPTEYLAAAAGGGLGYANDSGNGGIPNSVAVKFDIYDNSGEGSNSTGLFVDGDSPTLPSGAVAAEASVDMTSSGVKLNSGDAITATLAYDGTTLSETVVDSNGHGRTSTFTTSYTIDIPATIGSPTAYVGFTAATGGATSTQKVAAWTYAEATAAPYAPTSLAATAPSSTELDLSWADPYSSVSSYAVYRQGSSGTFALLGTTAGTTYADTGLTADTTYAYKVTATNSAGSATSAVFTGTTPTRPALVTNLAASGTTSSGTTLTWQNAAGVTGLTLTRTLVPDDTVTTVTLAAGTTTYADTGLAAGREYDYAVVGTNAAGPSQPATVAVQTTPGQVQNLDGTVDGTTISLLWDALGGAVATYNVYRGTSPGGEGSTPIATGVTGTTYRDPNLVTGVTYYYTVTGTDAGGEGTPSIELSALAAAPTPDLVISEFLADNKTGLTDAAGAHSDWIEIHNAGSGDADLSQYTLTDDPTNPELWRFPQQTLAAGGYLVVWADGLDQAVAGRELHANFSLGDAGEYLGLYGRNDVVQFEYAPAYPAQNADISYGLSDSDDPAGARQFFGTPTPAAADAPTAQGAVFSQAGKTFSGTLTVTLTSPTPGAQIRYTTDRTAPTGTSTLYTGPITVAATTMVRARVFAAGYTASVVTSQTYLDLGSTLSSYNNSGAAFSNNLGIVVIDTFGQALNDTTDILAGATFIPASNGTASLSGASNYDGRIGLHIRGNSSEGFPKQQWGITLWDENDNNQKASLMGMPSDSKWILNDPFSEKSLMQNPLVYKWANETGQYASRTQFVEVFLNTTGTATESYAANYWGIYVLEERVKIASGRVDINSMSPTDTTLPAISGGYIWEKDRPDASDATFTTTSGQQYINVEPNASAINSAQESYITNYVDQFEAALNGPNYKSPTAGYAAYIDVKSFADTWLIEELEKNIDGFRLSSYYYKDENGKIHAGPIWDNNLGLGNSDYTVNGGSNPQYLGSNPVGFDSAQLTDAEYPYYNRLFTDPAFKQAVTDEWSRLRAGPWGTANLTADIDNYTALLSNGNGNYPVGANGATPTQAPNNAVVRNFEKWTVLGKYSWPNGFYDSAGRWIQDVTLMKNWVVSRVTWMDSQLPPGPAFSPPPGNQTSPVSVTLTSNANANLSSGTIYYTTDGSDPRNADGSVSGSATPYTAALNLSANTTVNARSYLNGTWSGLTTGQYQFAKPTLAVTELNFDPARPAVGSPYSNEDFEYIEFENYGAAPVNLNGVTFTAGIDYTFGNVTLAPGQVGVLVHNTAAFQSRYGTSATLLGDYQASNDSFSNGGETVTVVDALGNTLVSFAYVGTWFAAAHGGGSSMEVIHPLSSSNLSSATSWQPSAPTPGTVGLYLSGPTYLRADPTGQYLDVWTNATGTGAFNQQAARSAVNAITYTGTAAGGGGLTVDFSNGNPLVASGLTFNGGTGSLAPLTIVGTAGNDTLTVNATAVGFTSSLTGSVGISYGNAAAVYFNGGTGADVLTQAAQPGAGTLAFVNPTAADTLDVAAGTYAIAAPAPGAGVVATTLGTVSVSAGATLTLVTAAAHADRTLLVVSNLTLAGTAGAWTARLDLGGNDLDVVDGNAATLFNQIAQGSAGSANGIVSSAAAANAARTTTLGMAVNQDGAGNRLYGSGTVLGLFDGANPAPTDVLVKYTYDGDANLDGKVDGADYGRIDAGYAAAATGWFSGDFNYDGRVDGSDYTLIDNAFDTQAMPLTPSVVATPSAMVAAPTAIMAAAAARSDAIPATAATRFTPAFASSAHGVGVAPLAVTAKPAPVAPARVAAAVPTPFYQGNRKLRHAAARPALADVLTTAV